MTGHFMRLLPERQRIKTKRSWEICRQWRLSTLEFRGPHPGHVGLRTSPPSVGRCLPLSTGRKEAHMLQSSVVAVSRVDWQESTRRRKTNERRSIPPGIRGRVGPRQGIMRRGGGGPGGSKRRNGRQTPTGATRESANQSKLSHNIIFNRNPSNKRDPGRVSKHSSDLLCEPSFCEEPTGLIKNIDLREKNVSTVLKHPQ